MDKTEQTQNQKKSAPRVPRIYSGKLSAVVVMQSNPPSRDAYKVKEIKGAVRFSIAAKDDCRVGDTVMIDDLETFITDNPNVDFTVVP